MPPDDTDPRPLQCRNLLAAGKRPRGIKRLIAAAPAPLAKAWPVNDFGGYRRTMNGHTLV
jgi:hypothetical protein